jgi:hypothetical protein
MECGGAKREEVKRYWRKLRDEKLGDLYCLTNTVRVVMSRDEVEWHVARTGGKGKCIKFVGGKR